MDRLEEWRAFVTVAGLSSFSKAARKLGRSPQSITRAIVALEKRLRTRLLNRTTRSVSLTNDGERQLDKARRALADFELLESDQDANAELVGRVSITAPVLFGQLHVLPIVTAFLQAHPRLDVRLLLRDRVVSLAEEGLDVGVRLGALPDSSLLARTVGQVRRVVCAAPAYLRKHGTPQTPDELARHQCISFGATAPATSRWTFRGRNKREQSVAVHPRLSVNTAQAAIDAAVAGLGIAGVLSYQAAKPLAAKRLRLILIAYENEPAPIQLVHLPGVQTRAAAAFIEFAAGRLRARLAAK
jgi:DNA-binding transcriptional LysR family regulator